MDNYFSWDKSSVSQPRHAHLIKWACVMTFLCIDLNLKKRFVVWIVVAWKPCSECPGDGCTWRKYFPRNLLTYLLTYCLSQSDKVRWNSAIFQMIIIMRLWSIILHSHIDKELTIQLLSWSGLSLQRYNSLNRHSVKAGLRSGMEHGTEYGTEYGMTN